MKNLETIKSRNVFRIAFCSNLLLIPTEKFSLEIMVNTTSELELLLP